MANALIAFTLANAACELVTPIRYARTMTLWSRGRGDCGETAKIGAVCGYLIQIAATFTWYELAVLGIIPGGASDGTVDFELRLIHQMFTYVTFGAVFAIWLDDLAVVGAPVSWCSSLARLYQFFSTRMIACMMIMASRKTPTAWHPFWTAAGYTASAVKGAGKDVILKYAYYFCRAGFSVVSMAIALTGVFYWNPVRAWFIRVEDSQSRASRTSNRKEMMRTIFWHCAFGLIFSAIWITASNSGIPRIDAIKGASRSTMSTHYFEPWIPGHQIIHAKNHGQTMIAVAYATFIAYSLNYMDDGGLWISKVLSIQLPAQIYNFFVVIYIIVALGGGTIFHPTWYTNGWAPSWATHRMLDWLFFVGTGHLTIFGVPLITYALLKHLSIPEFKPYATASMGFFTKCMRHGMVSILFSGLWMMAVSTGVPMPDAKLTAMFGLPPLHKLDVRETIKMHHVDIIVSIIIMANGYAVLALDRVVQLDYKLHQFITVVWKHSMTSRWVYFWCAKILLHGGERFTPPNVIVALLRFRSQVKSTSSDNWFFVLIAVMELYSFTAMMLLFLFTLTRMARASVAYLRNNGQGQVNWTTGLKQE